jgi:hypothetical protein
MPIAIGVTLCIASIGVESLVGMSSVGLAIVELPLMVFLSSLCCCSE